MQDSAVTGVVSQIFVMAAKNIGAYIHIYM